MTHSPSDQPAAQFRGIKSDESRVRLEGSEEALFVARHLALLVRVDLERLAHAAEVIGVVVNMAPPAGKDGTAVTPEALARHQAEMTSLLRDAARTLQTQRDHLASSLNRLLDELDLKLPV
jgi:hypothetical protein